MNDLLEFLGVATQLKTGHKYFKSNLFNNNWLIVLLSSIQYRIYKSAYYNEKLNDKERAKNRSLLKEKKKGLIKLYYFLYDVVQLSIAWIAMLTGIILAYIDSKSLINLFAYYLNSFVLILTYTILDKKDTKQLLILRVFWYIGIFFYLFAMLFIYGYQIFCLKLLSPYIPKWIEENKDFLGVEDLTKLSHYVLPIRFLSYALPFICSIIVKRQLKRRYLIMIGVIGDRESILKQEESSIKGYVRWRSRLRLLWPILDFLARS
jgi:hypothetical protein